MMFTNMRTGAPWNVDAPLLWGYFFTSQDKSSLETASKALIGQGYRLVDIHLGDKEKRTDPDIWWLHVERVELHTVESLDARNAQFYAFAAKFRRVQYDGMDVGPAS
ncbi:MAG: ribonuclease E inhibitor RraB [bacterium]|nr:ribonuclease E inhibitor RraB [bacterium]